MAAETIKDLDKIRPIDHAVIARPHTPVYKMQRYFARRPWSVFRALIKHYSNPGSIILDPFCGGGVTVVEGLRLGRKVIGVDINPLATFITRMEVTDVDLTELEAAFEQVEAACRELIEELYLTDCPNCGKRVSADWYEWSKSYQTPEYGIRAVVTKCRKVGPGEYEAQEGSKKERFKPLDCKALPDVLIHVHVPCPHCRKKSIVAPSARDVMLAKRCTSQFDKIVHNEKLTIPNERIPDMNMARENALFKRGITHFRDLFTPRNLIANGRLKNAILAEGFKDEIRDFLGLAFSGSLRFTNNMVFRNTAWRGDKPLEWAKPAYWIPDTSLETNVWRYFRARLRAIRAAIKYIKAEIHPPAQCVSHRTILKESTKTANRYSVITGSSDRLPLPDASIDVIITDPPYGGNVQYLELSDFWIVWLHEWINVEGVTDKSKEAITTRHRGFEGPRTSNTIARCCTPFSRNVTVSSNRNAGWS